MKKTIVLIAIIFIVLISLFNTGCVKKSDAKITTTTQQTEEVTVTTTIESSSVTTRETTIVATTETTVETTVETIKEYIVGEIPVIDIVDKILPLEGMVETISYDLGKAVISQQYAPMDMPYRMQGIIALPSGEGKHPVIFIIHGSHKVETESDITTNRYDLGFKYLLEELASYGYAAVSINVNAQYALLYGEPYRYERLVSIFNDHLVNLQEATDGKDMGFGIDLTGRLDLSQIILIGHSRGGQGVHYINFDQKEKGNTSILGLVLVTPAEIIIPEIPYADVPIGIIISELDGDIVSLHGQQVFDKFRTGRYIETTSYAKTDSYNLKKSPVSLVYLYGANHNFFNTSLENDDFRSSDNRVPIYKRLTAEEQRSFLKRYIVDYVNNIFGKTVNGMGMSLNETSPGSLYDYKVLTSYDVFDKKIILLPSNEGHINKNLLNGDNISEKAVVGFNMDTSFYKTDSGPFRHPTRDIDIGLLNISWETKEASFRLMIPDAESDFLEYKALSIYMAVDPTNILNQADKNQSFTIIMIDEKGRTSKVLIDYSAPAMKYHSGHLVENEYADYWLTFSPLNTLRIPIEYFQGIDISAIESIAFLFDQTDNGSIMVSEISLMK